VNGGLFVLTLDFGQGAFSGANRWLQIDVRTNGSIETFAPLDPRQPVTPTPYATFAANAASASNIVAGAVVTSVNNLKDNVTLAAGSNVTITPSGNTLMIHVPNSGSSNWFGSGGNTYFTSGNVGIGTTTPGEKLTIAGVPGYNTGLKLTGNTSAGTGLALENTSVGGHKYSLLTGGSATSVGAGGLGIYDDTIGDYRLAISPGGNVGIGTPTPARKLTVFSGQYGFEHTDGSVRVGSFVSLAGGYLGTVSNHKLNFFVNDGGASMTIDTAQNVGIGTTTPAAKLEVNGGVLVRQNLTFEAGGSPTLYTGVGNTEQNRYLNLINTAASPSASGLKAGGILVSDSYDVANPGKNELIVRGNTAIGLFDTSLARLSVSSGANVTAIYGKSETAGYGVYGKTAGNTASSAGVYGEAGGVSSYAGYFQGNTKVTEGLIVTSFGTFGSRVVALEFIETSDRDAKTNFANVDARSVLTRVLSLPIQTWNFTNQSESVRHIGPMAQDFYAAFNVGQDDKHISTIDAAGVAFAAIQGLGQKLEEEVKRNRARDVEISELRQRLGNLENLLRGMNNAKE
jgi:trimeric autotransporter adhesin